MGNQATRLLVLGIAANCSSISTALSPVPTFLRIANRKSTEKFDCFPYVASAFSNAIWLLYGFVTPNSLFVITISSVLVVVYGIYCLVFLRYASTPEVKQKAQREVFGALGVAAVVYVLTCTAVPKADGHRSLFTGLIGDFLSVVQVGAPLAVIGVVIKTKSAEFLPLALCANNLLNNTVWGMYSIAKKDVFVGAPCIPGVLLAGVSVLMHAIYPSSKGTAAATNPEYSGITVQVGGSFHGGISVHGGCQFHGGFTMHGIKQLGSVHGSRRDSNVLGLRDHAKSPLLGGPLERIDSMPGSPSEQLQPSIFNLVSGLPDTSEAGPQIELEEVHGGHSFGDLMSQNVASPATLVSSSNGVGPSRSSSTAKLTTTGVSRRTTPRPSSTDMASYI